MRRISPGTWICACARLLIYHLLSGVAIPDSVLLVWPYPSPSAVDHGVRLGRCLVVDPWANEPIGGLGTCGDWDIGRTRV